MLQVLFPICSIQMHPTEILLYQVLMMHFLTPCYGWFFETSILMPYNIPPYGCIIILIASHLSILYTSYFFKINLPIGTTNCG